MSFLHSRTGILPTDCVLCGKSKIPVRIDGVGRDLCDCPSVEDCKFCEDDIHDRLSGKARPGFQYKCSTHGKVYIYIDFFLN